jgi:hypothetical protein
MQPNIIQPPNHGHTPGDQPNGGMISSAPFVTSMPPPAPTQPPSLSGGVTSDMPVPVVQALSVRGVEYAMMSLSLWFGAGALLWALLSVINGGKTFDLLALPAAILVVSVPIFGLLFLRLRREELADPALRLDPSKRRLSQFTQIFTFSTCFFNVIAFVYELMQKFGGRFTGSFGKLVLNLFVVFVVAGGIFMYYWVDEHRLIRNR